MDRESVDRLRFDRRLERRRGWAEDADREANLNSLPDVSSKMTRGFDQEEADSAESTHGAAGGAAPGHPLASNPGEDRAPRSTPGPFGGGTEFS